MKSPVAVLALVGALALAGCDRDAPFGPLPPGEASVAVQAFYEYDRQAGFGGVDQRALGLRFQLTLPGSNTPVAEGAANEMGVVLLDRVPVGTYDLRVDPAFLGDSLVMTEIDTARVTLVPDDVLTLSVGVTPVSGTVAQARSLPEGRRLWVDGIALNGRGASFDQSIHVLGSDSSAVRVNLPTASPGSEGDSVRVLGRTVSNGATRYLADGLVVLVSEALRPVVAHEVEVAEVGDASGGSLDARLVVARDAVVADTLTVPFVGRRVTIQSGDDEFVALLRNQNGFDGPLVPGTPVVAIAGLLVPDPDTPGRWLMVPRSRNDALFGQLPSGG
ncbi:hypothetical protein [Gaopeijia maritima]|uniref:DUF4382 domain-containing protein n=1 Tax=Gaopeijia maritima TaxID=3119007 RepID=A0ABU9E3W7_9BACT